MQLNSQLWIGGAPRGVAITALQVLSTGVEHKCRNKVWKQLRFHVVFMYNHFA